MILQTLFCFTATGLFSCRRIFLQILLFLRISDQVGQSAFCATVIYRKILVGCRRHNVAAILHQAINNTNCVFFLRQMLHIANLFVLTNG